MFCAINISRNIYSTKHQPIEVDGRQQKIFTFLTYFISFCLKVLVFYFYKLYSGFGTTGSNGPNPVFSSQKSQHLQTGMNEMKWNEWNELSQKCQNLLSSSTDFNRLVFRTVWSTKHDRSAKYQPILPPWHDSPHEKTPWVLLCNQRWLWRSICTSSNRTQAMIDPTWLWKLRTSEVRNRRYQWLYKMHLGPKKKKKATTNFREAKMGLNYTILLCFSYAGHSLLDPLFLTLCNLDDELPARYISYTNAIIIQHSTGVRSLTSYYGGFLLNFTVSKWKKYTTKNRGKVKIQKVPNVMAHGELWLHLEYVRGQPSWRVNVWLLTLPNKDQSIFIRNNCANMVYIDL